MSPRDHDDNEPLPEIPAIIPDRDDVEHYQRQKVGRQQKPVDPIFNTDAVDYEDEAAPEPVARVSKAPLYVLGVIAVVAVAWAGVLQTQLMATEDALESWQGRVADLEKRLSVTDESSTQSAAAMQIKLKELDEGFAKLRDDNLKKAKSTLDQHTSQIAALDQTLKATQGTASKVEKAVDEQEKTLAATKGQIDKLTPIVDQSKRKIDEHQTAIDAQAEKGNVASANIEKLGLRMNTNEEWVQSINNFRKQTNREIVNIKQQIGGPVSEANPR